MTFCKRIFMCCGLAKIIKQRVTRKYFGSPSHGLFNIVLDLLSGQSCPAVLQESFIMRLKTAYFRLNAYTVW